MSIPVPAPAGVTDRLMASSLVSDIEFLTARARALGSSLVNERLRPLGLRVRSYAVLTLACDGIGPSQRQLAEFLSLDPSQIVSLVDELEKSGFVRRETDPSDRRSKVIVATEEGERVRAEAAAAVAEGQAVALGGLTPEERETLRSLLAKVAFPPAGE